MKLGSFKRLFKTDFDKDDQPLIEKLSFFFNNGIEVLYNLLNGNVSLSDNILCNVKDFSVVVASTGVPTSTINIPLSFSNKVSGVQVMNVTNTTNASAFPTGGVHVTWSQNNKSIFINHITGLITGNSYTIRIVIYGE